jgi:hypothetical protein
MGINAVRGRGRFRWGCAAALVAALLAGRLGAETLHVPLTHLSIQEALDAARDGDTVLVEPGEYVIFEPLQFNRLHDPRDPKSPPRKDLSLISEGGAELTVLRAKGRHVILFDKGETPASRLEGFLLTGAADSALVTYGSAPVVAGCVFSENEAINGAGAYLLDEPAPSFEACTFTSNQAINGGGVCAVACSVTLRECLFQANTGILGGAVAFFVGGSLRIENCEISDNSALMGGGIWWDDGNMIMVDSRIRRNTASDQGGGLLSWDAEPSTIMRCEIVENSAALGAGIRLGKTPALIEACEIRANTAIDGGAITFLATETTISRSVVSGNRALRRGGALFLEEGARVRLENCEVAGNAAGAGGAASITESTLSLLHATVTANTSLAASAGVFLLEKGSAEVLNSIVFGNSDPLGLNTELEIEHGVKLGGELTVAYSCIEAREQLPGAGNVFADPLFADPGRWTWTGDPEDPTDDEWEDGDLRLLPGSPAIDAASRADALAADLGGNFRPCGAGPDMGAHESGGCAGAEVHYRRGDANADGRADLTDAVFTLNHLFLGGPAPGCARSADVDDSGALNLSDPVYLLNHLFLGGRPPPEPFAECGASAGSSTLDCGEFPACAAAAAGAAR